jgi:hypothetical protein
MLRKAAVIGDRPGHTVAFYLSAFHCQEPVKMGLLAQAGCFAARAGHRAANRGCSISCIMIIK